MKKINFDLLSKAKDKVRGKAWIIAVFGLFFVAGAGIRIGAGVVSDYYSGGTHEKERAVPASHSVGGKELPIYCVDTKEKKVALSFDAAWGAEDFTKLMKVLNKHRTKVTFFMTGGWVEKNPDCVKYLTGHGHDLGNHSEHHYDMATISADNQRAEIKKVHDKVKALTGVEMFLFRPPYGSYNNSLIRTIYEMKYYPIQWSVDSLDWKGYDAKTIVNKVCDHRNLAPGAIILCHNAAKHTAEALDELLTRLEEKGYEVVPISRLILREKYHMDVTGKQIAD